MDQKMPKRLERTTIYESDFMTLYSDRVEMPNGSIIEKYHQLHYARESVCVLVQDGSGRILMELNKRYTTGTLEWELPAGGIDKGELPEEAAAREVMEETGCGIKELRYLSDFYPANSFCDLHIHFFSAVIDSEGEEFDTNEVAEYRWFEKQEVLEMMRQNKLHCGTTLAGLAVYLAQ